MDKKYIWRYNANEDIYEYGYWVGRIFKVVATYRDAV